MTDIANQTAGGQIFTDVLSSFADRWGDLGFWPELGFLGHYVVKVDKEMSGQVNVWRKCMNGIESIKGLRFEDEYVSLDLYDASSGFLQPLLVNEEHAFHTYISYRYNRECAFFGYLSVCDWVWFFIFVLPGGERLYGTRSLISIYSSLGTPFIEEKKSKSGYQFEGHT